MKANMEYEIHVTRIIAIIIEFVLSIQYKVTKESNNDEKIPENVVWIPREKLTKLISVGSMRRPGP